MHVRNKGVVYTIDVCMHPYAYGITMHACMAYHIMHMVQKIVPYMYGMYHTCMVQNTHMVQNINAVCAFVHMKDQMEETVGTMHLQ